MTEKDYTPIVAGASPDNPVVTEQYDYPDAVHPNREDFEEGQRWRARMLQSQMVRQKTLSEKIGDWLDWTIHANNQIRLPAYLWIVFFFLWWVAMLVQVFWLPASLSSVYNQMHYTFDLQATGDIMDLFTYMVMIVFPIYVLLWSLLSLYEGVRNWRIRRRKGI